MLFEDFISNYQLLLSKLDNENCGNFALHRTMIIRELKLLVTQYKLSIGKKELQA